jgi:hypothetical protein
MAKAVKQTKSTQKWSDVVIGRKYNCCMLSDVLVYSIPTILNGQVSSSVYNGKKGTKWEFIKNLFNSVKQTKDRKILLISDSHGRECAKSIKYHLPSNYEVCGYVKPGMPTDTILKTAPMEIKSLTKNEAIVLWCGSNDIARNSSSTGLKNIFHFIKNSTHTKVIVVSLPLRYDLSPFSCTDNEVLSFNKKLEKIVKSFNYVSLIKIESCREDFTRHGLHLNRSGKLFVSKQIAK